MSWTFYQDKWLSGNPKILGPLSQAMWLGSMVFDGARAFENTVPDLELHMARVVRSALAIGLNPNKTATEITEIALDAVRKFPAGSELYIRPMFWAEKGGAVPDADSTQFALCTYREGLPPDEGFSATLSSLRRPLPDTMVTGAKASCLYPAIGQPLAAARRSGFDTIVMLDPWDNLAEFATANLFLVRNGVVYTPIANATYLNGITRQRVIKLLTDDGIDVVETRLRYHDLEQADEAFSSGNHAKLQPMTRLNSVPFKIGPVYKRIRKLYWEFAHNTALLSL